MKEKKQRKPRQERVPWKYFADKKNVLRVYIVLRVLVLLTLVWQLLSRNYENVFVCLLTLILFLLMRPHSQTMNIRPIPSIPTTAGYGTVSAQEYAVIGQEEVIPAQPDAVPSGDFYSEPLIQDSGALTPDSIVYAVTNNASSYHLYEICDMQENRRALTLRDAMNEGLQPCSKCVGTAG